MDDTDITEGTDALDGVDTSGQDQATSFDDGSQEPAAAPAQDAPATSADDEAEAAAAAEETPKQESDADRFRSQNRDIAADIAEARADLEGDDDRGKAAAGADDKAAGDGGKPDQKAETEGSASEAGETSPGDAGGQEPFSHWSETAKTTFQSQPAGVRQWMLDRETEFGEALTRGTDIAKDMIQTMAPYSQQLARAGMSPADGLRRLVGAHDLLERDPRAGLAFIVDLYGIDLQNLNQTAASESLDPEINSLRQSVGDLTKTVSSLSQNNTDQNVRALESHINAFKAETDAAGNVKHPYFDEVRNTMGILIEAGQAPDMEAAYTMAVYANPSTRARAVAMETGRPMPTPTPKPAANDAVKKAKRAAGGQVSSGTSDSARASSDKPGGNSLRDDLRAGYREQVDA